MKTNTITPSGTSILPIVLGIVAVALIFLVLTGRKVPLLTSDRASLLALVVIGMAICGNAGIGRVAATNAWFHPLSIVGYLLGAAIIVVGIAALIGKNIPPLTNYYQSFIAVSIISVVKVVLTTIHRLLL